MSSDGCCRGFRLQVGGGIKTDNIGAIAAAGADICVAGSAIFDAPDYRTEIAAWRKESCRLC